MLITQITSIGNYCITFCAVCKEKLSPSNTTNLCQKHYMEQRDVSGTNNPFYNKKHSEETRKRLSDKRKGVKPCNTLKVVIDNILYNSFTDAARILNCSVATIRNRCNSDKFSNYVLYQEV